MRQAKPSQRGKDMPMPARSIIFGLLSLIIGACTLIGAPAVPPTPAIGTGEAPPDVLTPNALRTPSATPFDETRCRVVNEEILAMREFADIMANEVTILAANTTSEVIGRIGNNSWWRVQIPSGAAGWLDASAVDLYGDCTNVPIMVSGTATPVPSQTPVIPVAQIKIDSLNVRSGPSVRFNPPIGRLLADNTVELLAVNTTRDWYKISFNNREGWISGSDQYVEVAGLVSSLPVEPGPPTPTATNTPIPATPTATLDPNTNYLDDPSFEGAYVSRGFSDLNTPSAWQMLYYESPREYEWQNLRPFAFPHRTAPEIRNGSFAQNINRNYGTFTAVMYQQATVPANITVNASAWAWLHTCDPDPGICNSDTSSGAKVRVGIDPNGGTNPFAGSVVWSGFIAPHDSWGNVGVSTQANGSTVTVFLYGTQDVPKGLNQMYWDDAALTVGG